jgi:hypothetical protein
MTTLVIAPRFDPTGTVRVEIDADRREVVVTDEGEVYRYVLDEHEPQHLGWALQGDPRPTTQATVGEVVSRCLRDWDAEQIVAQITLAAAVRADQREGDWAVAAARLRRQVHAARRLRRVPARIFQKWWVYLADERRPDDCRLSEHVAALRAGYVRANGDADTARLLRRMGIADNAVTRCGVRSRSSHVNYETALTLCRALGRDPVDLGL